MHDHGWRWCGDLHRKGRSAGREEAAIELSQLREQVKVLREALEPFASAAEDLDDDTPDRCSMWEHHVSMDVEAGDFRRAAYVLSTYEGESTR